MMKLVSAWISKHPISMGRGTFDLGCFHFTGVIGVVLLHGKEYRLATYLGAKVIKIQPDEIIIEIALPDGQAKHRAGLGR